MKNTPKITQSQHKKQNKLTKVQKVWSQVPLRFEDNKDIQIQFQKLTKAQQEIFKYIMYFFNINSVAYVCHDRISAQTGYCRRTVIRAIERLHKEKFLASFYRHMETSLYKVNRSFYSWKIRSRLAKMIPALWSIPLFFLMVAESRGMELRKKERHVELQERSKRTQEEYEEYIASRRCSVENVTLKKEYLRILNKYKSIRESWLCKRCGLHGQCIDNSKIKQFFEKNTQIKKIGAQNAPTKFIRPKNGPLSLFRDTESRSRITNEESLALSKQEEFARNLAKIGISMNTWLNGSSLKEKEETPPPTPSASPLKQTVAHLLGSFKIQTNSDQD